MKVLRNIVSESSRKFSFSLLLHLLCFRCHCLKKETMIIIIIVVTMNINTFLLLRLLSKKLKMKKEKDYIKSFSMYTSGLWFNLDEDDYAELQSSNNTEENNDNNNNNNNNKEVEIKNTEKKK